MKKVKKAIIPAAGYGTRNLPITKVLPKEMFPIGGKPAIQYIVEEAVDAGIEEILIVVSRNKNMILDYFDRSLELETFLEKTNKLHLLEKASIPNIHIQYIRQPYAEGLGDAVALGKLFVKNEPFAVILPDDIFLCRRKVALAQLIETYNEHHSSVIGLQKVKPELLKNYGVIKGEKLKGRQYQITDIVEKPENSPPSDLAVTGRYIFNPTIFTYLEKLEQGVGGEIQLTDAIKDLLAEENCIGMCIAGDRYDIGSDTDYLKLMNRVKKKYSN
ncbi:UTP--glucose-1-phosphate uridylyltransferase [Anaerobacillus sp. CMMVII]|uniref:UTP--glucose-1-phosphate uridylyltransferase n=1 Tax=Anaerobacillus sp. CMMVII TaxID=2755588 RepID=UPI0021B8073B|nr:UTP--glucose-1-phosphate uridylyltransferase [Anaerobacillus sp. CMMVII]MCT8140353.1 UTP--glucose-1-phosphate uridylyltransferase [Anaerobacillus sp. CMMVII]